MSWLGRVFGGGRKDEQVGKPEPGEKPDPADIICSFCGKHRREVRKLVAGPKVFICDECIALCTRILRDEQRSGGGGDYHADLVLAEVERRGLGVRHAEAQPALRAAIELARGARPTLVKAASLAWRLADHATALAALTAIADDARRPEDQVDRASCLLELGRRSEAAAALAELAEPADDFVRTLWRLARARLELEQGGSSRPQLAVLLQTARECGAAVAVLPEGPGKDQARLARLEVLTAVALALDELELAEESALDRTLIAPASAKAYAMLATVLRARGDTDAARAAHKRARELAHPDGALARELAATGDSPPFR